MLLGTSSLGNDKACSARFILHIPAFQASLLQHHLPKAEEVQVPVIALQLWEVHLIHSDLSVGFSELVTYHLAA